MKPRIFLLFLFLFGGCQAIQDLANSIQKPTLTVDDVRVTGFNFDKIELTYDVKVNNPNAVSLQMLGYDYKLDINGSSFLQGNQTKGIAIEASGASVVEVPMTINFKELYRTVKGAVEKDESSYHFFSTLAFNLPALGRTEIPVSSEGTIPMIKLPELSFEGLQIKNISLSNAEVNLKLQLNNPNGFGLNINELNYDLEVDGNNWASGNALQGVKINKNGPTELNIPVSLDITRVGISAYRMLQGSGSPDYRLKGNFSLDALHELLGATNFLFDKTGQIPLSR